MAVTIGPADRSYTRFVTAVITTFLAVLAWVFVIANTTLDFDRLWLGLCALAAGAVALIVYWPSRSLGAGLLAGICLSMAVLAAAWAIFAVSLAGA